jgi:hypothetical protein
MNNQGWMIVAMALLGFASSTVVADAPIKGGADPAKPSERTCQVQLDLVMAHVCTSELRRTDPALYSKWAKLTSEFGCLIALPTNGHDYLELLQQVKDRNLVKFMTKARLVTLSGHSASYFSGGEQSVPHVSGLGATAGVSFVPFGTRIEFLPIVQADQKIGLELEVEVSSLQPATGIEIQGVLVPGRKVQRVKTTLTMDADQTYVLGSEQTCERTNPLYPILGDWLATCMACLFNQQEEEESLLLVTPHFMWPHAMSSKEDGEDATFPDCGDLPTVPADLPPDDPTMAHAKLAGNALPIDRIIREGKELAGYLKGRVLGSLVCKGMTVEEVREILHGECCTFFLPAGFCYETTTMINCYHNEGLTVRFRCEKDGACYVDNVSFWPLLEDSFPVFGGPIGQNP